MYKMAGTIIAKLVSFEEGRRENLLYKCQAKQTEKDKAFNMIDYIKHIFGIGNESQEEKKTLKPKKIEWTRDERGNIVSPWGKKSLKKDEKEKPQETTE